MSEGEVGTRESCTCAECVSACQNRAGWFAYGEVERLAEHLGRSLPEVFRESLGVDFWLSDADEPEGIAVLAPAVVGMGPGEEYPFNPYGRCRFLTEDDRCAVHAARPRECREMLHGDAEEEAMTTARHLSIAQTWKAPAARAQIVGLLGREPMPPEVDLLSGLSLLFRAWR